MRRRQRHRRGRVLRVVRRRIVQGGRAHVRGPGRVRAVPDHPPGRVRRAARDEEPVRQEPGVAVRVAVGRVRGLRGWQLDHRARVLRRCRAHVLLFPSVVRVDADHQLRLLARPAPGHRRAARHHRPPDEKVPRVLGRVLAGAGHGGVRGRHRGHDAVLARGPAARVQRQRLLLVRQRPGAVRVLRRTAHHRHGRQHRAVRLDRVHHTLQPGHRAARQHAPRAPRFPHVLPHVRPHGAHVDRRRGRLQDEQQPRVDTVHSAQHVPGPVRVPGLHVPSADLPLAARRPRRPTRTLVLQQ